MGWLDALRDLGGALSEVTERWVPDAWVICMLLTAVALLLTLFGAGAGPQETVLAWGAGVWNLLELAMQFTIALVAAHACVASRPVHRTLDLLAGLPDPPEASAGGSAGRLGFVGDRLPELGLLHCRLRAVRPHSCVSATRVQTCGFWLRRRT